MEGEVHNCVYTFPLEMPWAMKTANGMPWIPGQWRNNLLIYIFIFVFINLKFVAEVYIFLFCMIDDESFLALLMRFNYFKHMRNI